MSSSTLRPCAVEVHKPVAIVDGQSEEIQKRQAEETGNLRSDAAALFPHIKCGHPQVFLPESGKLQKQIAGLIDIRHLAADPVDPDSIVAFDFARFLRHFVRDK